MTKYDSVGEVKLNETDQVQMSTHIRSVMENFEKISEISARTLGSHFKAGEMKRMRFSIETEHPEEGAKIRILKHCVENDSGDCMCTIDPPGICRPCTPDDFR